MTFFFFLYVTQLCVGRTHHELLLGDGANLLELGGTFGDTGSLLQEHGGGGRLEHEGERLVLLYARGGVENGRWRNGKIRIRRLGIGRKIDLWRACTKLFILYFFLLNEGTEDTMSAKGVRCDACMSPHIPLTHLEDGNLDGDNHAGLVGGPGVVLLAEHHDVHTLFERAGEKEKATERVSGHSPRRRHSRFPTRLSTPNSIGFRFNWVWWCVRRSERTEGVRDEYPRP